MKAFLCPQLKPELLHAVTERVHKAITSMCMTCAQPHLRNCIHVLRHSVYNSYRMVRSWTSQ